MDGFEFLQRLRKTSAVPVMIVSARDADEDMILGLGIGADEFVTKPFSPKVLVARVRAMLRRTTDLKASPNSIHFGDFLLDIDGYLLKKGGEKVPLSSKEFEVLAYLATHPGKALTPDTIYADVWRNQFGDVTAVAVYVQRLRKKIESDPAVAGVHRDGPRDGLPLQRGGDPRMKLRTPVRHPRRRDHRRAVPRERLHAPRAAQP